MDYISTLSPGEELDKPVGLTRVRKTAIYSAVIVGIVVLIVGVLLIVSVLSTGDNAINAQLGVGMCILGFAAASSALYIRYQIIHHPDEFDKKYIRKDMQ